MENFTPKGVCSNKIEFDVKDGKVTNVRFYGGCNGNLQGISRLVEGLDVDVVIDKLKGVKCGIKQTSCPDQLAKALENYKIWF